MGCVQGDIQRGVPRDSPQNLPFLYSSVQLFTTTTLHYMYVGQRRLVILLHARRCANNAIHGRFNPVQPAESADHNLRTSKASTYWRHQECAFDNNSITWPTSSVCGLCAGCHTEGSAQSFPKISQLQKQTVSKCQNYSHFRTFTVSWRGMPQTQKPTPSCCLPISILLKFHHRKHSYNLASLTIPSQVTAGQFISTHSKFALPPNVTIVF